MSEYIQLQRTTGGSVDNGNNIIFDSVIDISDNIAYDDANGTITIEVPGTFEISWQVATQTAQPFSLGVGFELTLNGSSDVVFSPLKTGQTSGSAILVVETPPVSLSLTNQSGKTVYLAGNLPVTASLTLAEFNGEGPTGATGPAGPPGPTGPTGASGEGAIIPFSSGGAMTLTTLTDGIVGIPGFVGFGSYGAGLTALGSTINLEGDLVGTEINFAFMMPQDATILGLNAFFSVTASISLIGTYFVHAVLYRSEAPADNEFDVIAESDIELTPGLTGLVTLGTIVSGFTDLNIPVNKGDRLLLAFYLQPPELGVVGAVTGYASAGLLIGE